MANHCPRRASRIQASLLSWLLVLLVPSPLTTAVSAAPAEPPGASNKDGDEALDPVAPPARARGPPPTPQSAVTRRRPRAHTHHEHREEAPPPVQGPAAPPPTTPLDTPEGNPQTTCHDPPTTATLTPSSGREFR